MPNPAHLPYRGILSLEERLLDAVQTENIEETRGLLQKGADPLFDCQFYFSHMVLRGKSPEITQLLIQSAKNFTSQHDYSIGNLFQYLTKTKDGSNQDVPLEKKLWVAELLCDSGIDANLKIPFVETPMIYMASFGEPALVALLLDHGGKIEDALEAAIRYRNAENVRLILSRKEVNLPLLRLREGRVTPLDDLLYSRREVNSDGVAIFELLLNAGYSLEQSLLSTYLSKVVKSGSLEFVSSVLASIFSASPDRCGSRPEWYASLLKEALSVSLVNKNLDIFRYLLKSGADPNAMVEGEYILIYALSQCITNGFSGENSEFVKLLVKNGACVQNKTSEGARIIEQAWEQYDETSESIDQQQTEIAVIMPQFILRAGLPFMQFEDPRKTFTISDRIIQGINLLMSSLGTNYQVDVFDKDRANAANGLLKLVTSLHQPFRQPKFKALPKALLRWTVTNQASEARSLPPEIVYLIVEDLYQASVLRARLERSVKELSPSLLKIPELISDIESITQDKPSVFSVFKDMIFNHDWCAKDNFAEMFLTTLLKKGQTTAALRLIQRGADVQVVAPTIKQLLFRKDSIPFLGDTSRNELLLACLVSGVSTEQERSHCGTDWLETMPLEFDIERPYLINARANLKASVLFLAAMTKLYIPADDYSHLLHFIFSILRPLHKADKSITLEYLETHSFLSKEVQEVLLSANEQTLTQLHEFAEEAMTHEWTEGPCSIKHFPRNKP